MSESSKSSPVASASWTRRPPKPATKKKKKLIAGRELRDRSGRKVYAEVSSDEDEDFLLEDEEEAENDVKGEEEEEEEEEEYAEDEVAADEIAEENEEGEVQQPKTRRITLKFKSAVLQGLSQGSQPPEPNGAKHTGEDDENDLDAPADVEDLEAEVEDLKATVDLVHDIVDDDEDDEGGPRKLTRRVTRQTSLSKPESSRPVHGRKGVARQNRSSENQNPNGTRSSPNSSRRASMKNRLRKELRRPSRDEKPKKKKAKSSESEFEDEGEEPDDDLSIESDKGVQSEEDYSSGPSRRHARKPAAPSRGRPKRSRNVSDDAETSDDAVDELEEELREIGAEIPQRRRQLRPTERMNYFIPPPPGKDDISFPPPSASKKRPGTGRGYGGFGGFGGDFSNMGLGDRFRGIAGLGTAGGAEDSSDSVTSTI